MENKRLAINTGITLSSNLISACLAMLTIIGAFFTFVLDKRDVTWLFYVSMALSFCFFVYSIICGGKGINIVRRKAFQGVLDLDCSKSKFNIQAMCCLLGIFFCILSIVFTSQRPEENDGMEQMNKNIERLIRLEESRRANKKELLLKIEQLEEKVKRLNNKAEAAALNETSNTKVK